MLGRNRLSIFLFMIPLSSVMCKENFTALSSSQVMWVNHKMSYSRAVSNCATYGANLVEIWNEQEWTEVSL